MLNQIVSLFHSFTQSSRLLRLSTPLGANILLAESVHCDESLCTPYSVTIGALSLDAGISLRSLLGQPALLQLLTVETGAERAFHGRITAVELAGANGGMARYVLTVQPWIAFLGHGRDSRIFQDMTVFDILDAVFGAWQSTLAPAWRFDIADRAVYPVRSLTTQYQESDLAFVQRLMAEEGLFYFFEHEAAPDSPGLGAHCMVIADHNGAFTPHAGQAIRFTQPGAVMKDDAMDRWRSEINLATNAVGMRSWNYRARSSVAAASASQEDHEPDRELAWRDTPGPYAYANRSQGQRLAENHLQALDARRETFTGAGTVRTLRPGTLFTLTGEAVLDLADSDDGRTFIATRAVHIMHNNLHADLRAAADALPVTATLTRLLAHGSYRQGERPLYRNRIEAIRAAVPYRPLPPENKPTVPGQQTAIVVGPPGAVIHTDRDHRVKVQFHWQRGGADGMGHSRLAHPAPDTHTGAPGDDRAGTWVRVATALAPVAGANWGANAIPRVGQEVLVDFLEGDIDRPVIIGALYNGRGAPDAQGNQVLQGGGAATGNAPPWFPGEGGGHAHAAVLSGLKSQAMQASQRGDQAYSQLVFDDTAGQPRVALQHHAGAHDGTAQLNLGHVRHQTDNQRLQPAGFGAELATAHSLALRAGQGMLLSADARRGGYGSQLDAREAQGQVGASHQLQVSLAQTAQQHKAVLAGDSATPAELPALASLEHVQQVIGATAPGGGQGSGFSEALLQLSSPSGIVAATPASALLSSAGGASMTAGQDINHVAQGSHALAVQAGISLFTYGKAVNEQKPNQETGIRLHAASGKTSSQSQSGATRITADKAVTVASTAQGVNVAAAKHVLLAAQGATLRLEGGNIELHAPGKVDFHASMKELGGPASSEAVLPALPRHDYQYAQKFQLMDPLGLPLANQAYTVYVADQQELRGKTDAQGMTNLIDTAQSERTYIIFDRDLQWICEDEDDEDTDICSC